MNTSETPCSKAACACTSEPRRGVIAALWVPTDANGRLMKDAVAKHISWLVSKGVYGALISGTTGEFIRFSIEERKRLLAEIAEVNAGRLPLLANLSAMRVDDVHALGKEAQSLGYKGGTLMTPWFFPLTQEDMLEHFLACADGMDMPAYLYNFPERTGNRIGPMVVEEFAKRQNMAGIKQSGAEYEYHKELIALGEKYDFSVFSGFDLRMPDIFGLGAKGVIGGLVNMAPEYMIQIYKAFHEGAKDVDVKMCAERLLEIGRIIDQAAMPFNVQFGLEARGFEPGVIKVPVSASTKAAREKVLTELRAKFAEWGLN